MVQVLALGDRENVVLTVPINAKECEGNVDITFRLTGVPTNQPTMDIYYGQNCQNSVNRLGSGSTPTTCTFVRNIEIRGASGLLEFDVSVQELDCAAGSTADRQVFFLPVSTTQGGDEVAVFGEQIMKIDTQPPNPPTEVMGGVGEATVPVTWTFTGTDVNEFFVYWDPNDTDCTSALLVPGQPLDSTGLGLGRVKASASARRTSISDALEVGQQASVAVVAVDLAGNESVLSNVDCIEGVSTTSWLELHRAQGGRTGDTCSVTPWNVRHAATPLMWLSVIALLIARARRRPL